MVGRDLKEGDKLESFEGLGEFQICDLYVRRSVAYTVTWVMGPEISH